MTIADCVRCKHCYNVKLNAPLQGGYVCRDGHQPAEKGFVCKYFVEETGGRA